MGNLRYVRVEERTERKPILKVACEGVDWSRILWQLPVDKLNLTNFGILKGYERSLSLDRSAILKECGA
jgi:hypothetical protein